LRWADEKSFGATEATVMRNVTINVREAVFRGAGHWLIEESPTVTVALIQNFLKDQTSAETPAH
jgi:pimeloyl-ACP methyl ester carboxylesterase